jgi:hypothetical protein
MLNHLFTKYVVSPLLILFISPGDCGNNGCLGKGGFLGIERGGIGRRGKRGDGMGARGER